MALTDEVLDRYDNARLVALTRPSGDKSTTTVDSDLLAKAAADATAEFELETAVTLDVSDAKHVMAACRGVIFYLHEYKGLLSTEGGREAKERWREGLEKVARVTGRDHIPIRTNSEQTPSDEAPDGATVRPWNDDEHWADLELKLPGE